MALLFRLSLFLLLVPLVPAAAFHHHHHAPAGGAAPVHPRRHHRSTANTATAQFYTAPSMHQNHIEVEEGQSLSLHVIDDHDPFSFAAQAPSGEAAIAAVGAAAEEANPTTLLDVPPQVAAPPSPLFAAPDVEPAPSATQPQEGVEGSASGTTAPPLDEPTSATTTTTLPLPRYRPAASPPPPFHAGVAGPGDEQRLEQLARVLTSLGYNEMASAAPLLADSTALARWPGAITVFAAPDVFLHASCPMCSRRHVLLEHIALGYFPYSELTASHTAKLPSASPGFCLNLASERGPFAIHHVRLYVDGVEVSHPELYNDGRYVVHGLHGFLPPLSHGSCFDSSYHHHLRHHHHLNAHSVATSAATAASVVRIMIREAIARLRDSGYSFVALAMRVKFPELERFANLTVFALDDQAIFASGGHDYVSAVRFHIVPGHHLTHDDLLRLHPGTMLPTLAGEGQNLVVTQGAVGSGSKDVRINYIPMKEPDVVINSRIAVHGVYVPFPRLHLANLAAAVALSSSIQMNGSCGVDGPFGDCASATATSPTVPAAHSYGEGH